MEFSHIGTQCSVEECKLHDFLPFTCDACNKVHCLDHRKYVDHKCVVGLAKNRILPTCPLCDEPVMVNEGEDPNVKVDDHISKGCPKNPKSGRKCSIRTCKNVELVPVICRDCHTHYCLKHRQPPDHKCPKWIQQQERLAAKASQVTQAKGTLQTFLEDLRNKFLPSNFTNPSSIAMASKLSVMRVKAKAIGDPKIDESKRFYLEVIFPQDSGIPSKMMFFNSSWSVGKTLDVIADAGPVQNNNNIPGSRKLRLFAVKTGDVLPNMKSLGELDNLKSGDPILLEREAATP